MKILVTGAKGFVGKNLCSQLRNIRDGKARWYNLPEPVEAIYEYDIDSTPEQLDAWCKECDFVFNLSDTQDLVTVMYCNEIFNPGRPDTYFDKVVQE